MWANKLLKRRTIVKKKKKIQWKIKNTLMIIIIMNEISTLNDSKGVDMPLNK